MMLFPEPNKEPASEVDFEEISKQFVSMRPHGGFKVALIDYPWRFKHYSEKGHGKAPQRHYNTMSIEDICRMPIDLLLADDAAVLMWVTWPLLMEWQRVIKANGLEFAGLAWEWIKFNPATEKYAFGGGYGTRKNLEPCLLCTKGNPKLKEPIISNMLGDAVIPEGVHSVRDFIEAMPLDAIRSPRTAIHSQKPEEQYERIETMFDGPYVELFSRKDRKNWVSWGDQAGLLNAV